jgi:hypothetical protein
MSTIKIEVLLIEIIVGSSTAKLTAGLRTALTLSLQDRGELDPIKWG